METPAQCRNSSGSYSDACPGILSLVVDPSCTPARPCVLLVLMMTDHTSLGAEASLSAHMVVG